MANGYSSTTTATSSFHLHLYSTIYNGPVPISSGLSALSLFRNEKLRKDPSMGLQNLIAKSNRKSAKNLKGIGSRMPVACSLLETASSTSSTSASYHERLQGENNNKTTTMFKEEERERRKQGDSNSVGVRILIAGAGIGGLVLALAAKKKGFDVKVLERDVSAIRGEGAYRGPIQIQSNALAALEAIDKDVAEEVMENGCITGDRINGLVDGISGAWYIKFDTFTPAAERGLPVTRVISRMALQEILARAVGQEIIENNSNVVDFEDDGTKVTVRLEDGRHYEGDLLVGADGIWSKVRKQLFGPKEATYSGYTCYTGIADFVPPDIETVGYRVFLGHKQYFVSSDVGCGKMQWYAFYNEPAGGVDPPNGKKERLLKLFGHWCDKVVDLLMATPEERILRRDIYDRIPIMTWSKGHVTLLGDSVHAMQPNLVRVAVWQLRMAISLL
uniref:FAD-binding domain-containing protein n=1 Tax=Picea sitchensis TaxID=3332 RepID=C0PSJ1_PICSI|nr:unknown [Picea sitchensis]